MRSVLNAKQERLAVAIGYGIDYGLCSRPVAIEEGYFYDYAPGDTGVIEHDNGTSYRIRATNGRIYIYASKDKWEERNNATRR